MFKKIRNIISLLFAVTFLISCSNLIEDRYDVIEINETSHESDLCYVTLNLSENGSRTVLPSFSFDECKFDLIGTLEGQTPEKKFNKVTYSQLTQDYAVPVTAGNWVFTVDCYDSTGTTKILTGTSTEYNINTEHYNIQIPMTFITGTSGSVNVKLNFPNGSDLGQVSKVTCKLYSNLIEADTGSELTIVPNEDGKTSHVVFTQSGLESGLKRYIKFYLYTEVGSSYKELAHFVEAVVIADNLTSEGEYTITKLKTSNSLTIKLKTDGSTYSGEAKTTLKLKTFPREEETISLTAENSSTDTYSATVTSGTRYFLYDGDYNTKLIFFPAAAKEGEGIYNGGIVEYCSSLSNAEAVLKNEVETTSGLGIILSDSTTTSFQKYIDDYVGWEYFPHSYIYSRKDKVSLNLELCTNVTSIDYQGFYCNNHLLSISTPNNVSTIGYNWGHVFSEENSLVSIYLNEGLKYLYIAPTMALEYIHIPASLTETSFSYYGKCVKLNTIDIDENNPRYMSRDGCVIAKVGGSYTNSNNQVVQVTENTLFSWPAACGDITVPDGVQKIDAGTFYQNTRITSVALPSSLTSIGEQVFYGCTSIRTIDIPRGVTEVGNEAFYNCAKLKEVTIPGTVTRIGSTAFAECYSLESVVLPESINTIGNSAFSGCTKLKSINIPEIITSINYGTFRYCRALRSIIIPENVTTIGGEAFYDCDALTSIIIPANVTTIGSTAFYSCNNLSSVTLNEGLQQIGNSTFGYCKMLQNIAFPSSLTSIGSNAFDSSGLVAAVIPDTVTSLGEFAYYNCSELKNVTIGNGVTTMGANPFKKCTNIVSLTVSNANTKYSSANNSIFSKDGKTLIYYYMPSTTIDIPATVETIGPYACAELTEATSISLKDTLKTIKNDAFRYCSGVTSLALPGSIETIESEAFYNCNGLVSLKYEEGMTSSGYNAFTHCYNLTDIEFASTITEIGESCFYYCYGLKKITLPNGLKTIRASAFSECNALTTVEVSTSLETIESSSFRYCYQLKTISLNEGLKSIGNEAFYHCNRLESITLPSTLQFIGSGAFRYCYELTSITLPSSIKRLGYYAFYECNKLESITVPANLYMYYSTSYYSYEFDALRNATKYDSSNNTTSVGDYINSNRTYYYYFTPNTTIEDCATAVTIYTEENVFIEDGEFISGIYRNDNSSYYNDWYKISVESGKQYKISFVNSVTCDYFFDYPDNLDSGYVYVYDSNFNEITRTRNSNTLSLNPNTTGIYYIKFGFNNYERPLLFRVWTQSTTNP